ncbi:aspartate--ammonia ligase [Culicoidibacter larvae]|uniref:Aspartate--ammonia ligase n=1 Tax=Culicoidibacter larvae TaxID=2579976 RepID=A0A5R8QAU2_9FIRM|nr:aspartate--ammonia ligase [Culicoidibacter larvae]TLG72990.1 aspartate--ammonia ligase [Culicoidibacter larvae]
MKTCIIPDNYHSPLDIRETEVAIKKLKDFFERQLAASLNLQRVSAPLFVRPESGLNDNLSGKETAVSFLAPYVNEQPLEVVHSLAKWKRMALYRYNFPQNQGLYTDMNAIRREEEPDNIHSLYVDQWDWERVIAIADQSETFLKMIVDNIYQCFRQTETYILNEYPELGASWLPKQITFIDSQELADRYPDLTAKQRENAIARECGAVFIKGIGHQLSNGEAHDLRAPDYDNWRLNGDIIFWYPPLQCALELSSMGIRVNKEVMVEQLTIANALDRGTLEYHRMLLEDSLPQTIGGGIGQSRLCMYFLRKAHIGEVQSSTWDVDTELTCDANGIALL